MLAVATGIQASDFVVDELCYNITDAEAKTVEVAKYDYTVDGEMVRPTKMDVVVPMTVVNPNDNQTYRVTALGDGAFTVYGLRGGWFDYTSIVLPEGLLEIKANAFSGQSKLTSLVIPGTVKSVKTKFAQMSGISELTFPASVKEMVTIESGRIQKLTIEGSPTITAGSRDYITGSVTNNIVYFIDNDTSYKNAGDFRQRRPFRPRCRKSPACNTRHIRAAPQCTCQKDAPMPITLPGGIRRRCL